jgi:hypothetical protein
MNCEIIMFEVEKKVFPLCPTGSIEFDCLWCKIFELRNFEVLYHQFVRNFEVLRFCTILRMHIMLGTFVSNLRSRG